MTYTNLFLTIAALMLGLSCTARAQTTPENLVHERVTVTTSEGLALAAYISRPADASDPLPAIFFTQAVACYSIAPVSGRIAMEERLAIASNYALIRLERSGTGLSEGSGCNALDYDTEVRHYREAFDQLSSHPWVDQDRIVIMGSSLGSTVAPLVALGKRVAGVVVQGGGALTYLERMLHFDRLQLERQAEFRPEEIDAEMRRRMEFHRQYLLGKMEPAQIEEQFPALAGVWESLVGTSEAPHYGRPYSWHWQAADKDWLSAWAALNVPVMVVYAEFEQFESRHGHRVIVDTVNRLRPATATWLEIPQAGHGLRIYSDALSAYAWEGGESRPELFVGPVSAWLSKIAKRDH